jgi:hypothetical protein
MTKGPIGMAYSKLVIYLLFGYMSNESSGGMKLNKRQGVGLVIYFVVISEEPS